MLLYLLQKSEKPWALCDGDEKWLHYCIGLQKNLPSSEGRPQKSHACKLLNAALHGKAEAYRPLIR